MLKQNDTGQQQYPAPFIEVPGHPTYAQLRTVFEFLNRMGQDARNVFVRRIMTEDGRMKAAHFAQEFVANPKARQMLMDEDLRIAIEIIKTAISNHTPADAIEVACAVASAL
jgi:hypothetical protein